MSIRRARDERGSVDNVIVWSGMLLMIVTLLQLVLVAHAHNVVQAAAEEGAASARRYDGSAGSGEAKADQYLGALGSKLLQDESVSVSRTGETATVTVSGSVVSLVGLKLFRVEATSSGPVERYVPPSGEFTISEGP